MSDVPAIIFGVLFALGFGWALWPLVGRVEDE